MKSLSSAIREAQKGSLEYCVMTVVYKKSNGDYAWMFYDDFLGDDGEICAKYVGGKFCDERE
jgi:hypothetical protein